MLRPLLSLLICISLSNCGGGGGGGGSSPTSPVAGGGGSSGGSGGTTTAELNYGLWTGTSSAGPRCLLECLP